jgi:DNA-binding MarR family transcriptional regulator
MVTKKHNHGCVSSDALGDLDLATLVSLLAGVVNDHLLGALDAAGVSGLRVSHGYVVQRLLEQPCTASQISAELGVSQQMVSKWIAELQTLGYVTATVDPADRRRRPVELSSRGRRAVEITRQARSAFESRLRVACGAQDVDTARRVLAEALDLLGVGDTVRSRRVRPSTDRA